MPTSAGLLMYRTRDGELEVLLVHPGGPLFANKDDGRLDHPQGRCPTTGRRTARHAPGASSARRPASIPARGPFLPLGSVKQKGGKTVHAWAFEGDCDPTQIVSNTFRMQWPPRSGKWITVPEVDRAAFFGLAEACEKINPAQAAFVTRLAEAIAKRNPRRGAGVRGAGFNGYQASSLG